MTIRQAMDDAALDALTRLFQSCLGEYLALWVKKQNDYGYENIAIYGAPGVVVRATDKVMRLKAHYIDGRSMENEVIEDTWKDLVGYGLIGLVCERGLWPKIELENICEEMSKYPAVEQVNRKEN